MKYIDFHNLVTLPRKEAKREFNVFLSNSHDDYYAIYVDFLWRYIHKYKSFNRDHRIKTRWLFEAAGYYDDEVNHKLLAPSRLSKIVKSTFKETESNQSQLILTTSYLDSSQITANNGKPNNQSWHETLIYKFFSSISEISTINYSALTEKICYTNKLISSSLSQLYKYIIISYAYLRKQILVFLFRDKHRLNPEPSDDHSDATYFYEICKLHFSRMNNRRIKLWLKKNMSQGTTQIMMNKLMLQTSNYSVGSVL